MLKILLFFLLLPAPSLKHRDPGNNHQIPWNESRRLQWEDFMGKPAGPKVNAALTTARINFSFGYGNRERLHYNISCLFEKDQSWVRVKNDWILQHEQGHFDLSEIYARKLYKAVRQYRFREKTATEDLNGIYESLMKEFNEKQAEYDQQTDFSRNPRQQRIWLEKIAGWLVELQDFAAYP
jgi:hypothetical protein